MLASQDGEKLPLPPVPAPARAGGSEAALVASDGQPVAPGRIPEGTAPEARALWERIVAAARAGPARNPVRSFDLRFDVVVRGESSRNDLGRVRYAFRSDQGWLRSVWEKSGRVELRGERGDWLIDADLVTPLVGRENAESRRELDEWVAIARNFLALSDPRSIAIVSLARADVPEVPMPTEELAKLAEGLAWLSVESPDFRVVTGSVATTPVYRAGLGVDVATGEVRLALLQDAASRFALAPSTLLVHVATWIELDGHRVPRDLAVHQVEATEPGAPARRFEERPVAELWLLTRDSRLDPALPKEMFLPPEH